MRVFDLPGTIDRYTIVLDDGKNFLGVSECLYFSQWGELKQPPGDYLGEEISFDTLPERVQKHVKQRLK